MRTALTIAGSDSGGGAGIQADLRAFTALDVFGTTAITCITAQNPSEVSGVEPVSPEMVSMQIEAVCAGFDVSAVKTGMLYSAEIVSAVAGAVRDAGLPNLVIDPVMVATSGARLLQDDAIEALCRELIPQAALLTPNVPELEVLCGHEVKSHEELKAAAQETGERFGVAVAAKAGHLAARVVDGQKVMVDILWDGDEVREFASPVVDAPCTHGTGCSFAAASAAALAKGQTLNESVEAAKAYVADMLRARTPQ